MNLNQWFEAGISIEAYEALLTDHRDNYHHIYQSFELPEDSSFINDVNRKNLRVVVIAEPWCGHCMMDVPILKKMCESADTQISICLRDSHPELMDRYKTDGKRVIPRFIFITDDGSEVAAWGPRAPKVKALHETAFSQLPPKDSDSYEAAFKETVGQLSAQFKNDAALWLDVYEDIKTSLSHQ